MKHYYNRLSKRKFCELKSQPHSSNYTVRGSMLGSDNEPWCLQCVYRKEQIKPNKKED